MSLVIGELMLLFNESVKYGKQVKNGMHKKFRSKRDGLYESKHLTGAVKAKVCRRLHTNQKQNKILFFHPVHLNESPVAVCDIEKYLGITINFRLKFKVHLSLLEKKIS